MRDFQRPITIKNPKQREKSLQILLVLNVPLVRLVGPSDHTVAPQAGLDGAVNIKKHHRPDKESFPLPVLLGWHLTQKYPRNTPLSVCMSVCAVNSSNNNMRDVQQQDHEEQPAQT